MNLWPSPPLSALVGSPNAWRSCWRYTMSVSSFCSFLQRDPFNSTGGMKCEILASVSPVIGAPKCSSISTSFTLPPQGLTGSAKRHKELVKRRVRTDVALYDEAVAERSRPTGEQMLAKLQTEQRARLRIYI